MEIESINSWNTPIWHLDFGSSEKELYLLKEICIYIHSLNSSLSYELDCYEEGYLRVNVYKNSILFFELHITDITTNKIGVFFQNDGEFYITKKEQMKTIFKKII